MILHLEVTRGTAAEPRSQAMVTAKALIINAPDNLCEGLDQIKARSH